MGRSYWFECARCGYRVVISGKPDRGHDFFAESISCSDCKKLYDAVVKLRVPVPRLKPALGAPKLPAKSPPPTFQAALTRLPVTGVGRHRWRIFKAVCPISQSHKVHAWRDPGPCPRCGNVMEKNPLPYRIWE